MNSMIKLTPVQKFLNSKILLYLIFLISSVSLGGWMLEMTIVNSFSKEYIPIAPSSAFFFLLLCSILFLTRHEGRIFFWFRVISIWTIVIFCLWICISYILKLPLDIENIFVKNPDRLGNVLKGRISPISALLFICVCIGITGIENRKSTTKQYIGGSFISLVFFSSFVLLTGYLYKAPLLYGSFIIPVALPSAICFFLISLYLILNYKAKLYIFNLLGDNKIKLLLLSWFLPIITIAIVVQGSLMTDLIHRRQNPTLTATVILLVILILTVIIVIRVSNLLGSRILSVENELRASQLHLKSLIKTIPDLIWLKDTKGVFLLANPTLERYFAAAEKEIVGKTDYDFEEKERATLNHRQDLRAIEEGKPISYEEFIVFPDNGQEAFLETFKMPMIDASGSIIGVLGISRDITAHKKAQEDLRKAKEKAEESEKLKSAFLANMSHEIRTPMNGILGFAELFKDNDLTSEEKEEYISLIQKSGERMLNIINDIISISKIDSGLMQVRIVETNVNEQLRYIQSFFRPEAEKKGIQLRIFNSFKDEEAFIKTDKEKLFAILTNLVKNAIKFTTEGAIEIGYKKRDSSLEFFISDSGTGIAFEQLDYIFERFRQGSESLTRNYEGAGLGLSISKGYVEMLGGKIWATSSLGKGSTFYFTLPGIMESEEKNPFVKPAEEEFHLTRKLKILIVEDDETSTLLLTNIVKPYGREILKAETGVQAVESVRLHPDTDLILMDIKLPEMDGYEAVKKIRDFNQKSIIIAQTAFARQEDQEKVLNSGFNDYIPKPVSLSLLREKIEKYFS